MADRRRNAAKKVDWALEWVWCHSPVQVIVAVWDVRVKRVFTGPFTTGSGEGESFYSRRKSGKMTLATNVEPRASVRQVTSESYVSPSRKCAVI